MTDHDEGAIPESEATHKEGRGVEDPLGPPGIDPEPDDFSADGASTPPAGDTGDAAEANRWAGASVEELIADLERTTSERNSYLDQLRRNQAEFENVRKRLAKQASDASVRAAEQLAEKLLPVLDACDAAIEHGSSDVPPVFAALLGTLEKEGLARVHPVGEEFDPTLHEAVFHEPGDGDQSGTVVTEVLRAGYSWNGRVIRPAMVKVKG